MIHPVASRAELDTLAYLLVDLDLGLVRDLHDQRKPLAIELSRPPGLASHDDVIAIAIARDVGLECRDSRLQRAFLPELRTRHQLALKAVRDVRVSMTTESGPWFFTQKGL
ncbi:hypothetical protein [Mesorhizobium sp. M0676]|uniref:hypothetical protein n=1 Tax=Mesorhizobium sp. M0676 TaxID=2956984 RepID=UPI00333AEA6E